MVNPTNTRNEPTSDPASPAKGKVFYGWWIVLSSATIGLYTAGAFFFGFTVFVNPIVTEFGWTYLAVSLAASLRSVEMGLAAPVMGFLVDRLGPRKLIFGGGLVAGLGFILLSRTSSLAMFYGAFVILSIGFSACATVVLITAVANWFYKRAGLAMGLTTVGFGMGGILLPVLVWLTNHHGWRTALFILGLGTWLVIPSLALVIRHRPEQYGYLPDGDSKIPTSRLLGTTIKEINPQELEPGVIQAARTKTFWFLSLALAIQFMGLNSVVIHVMPYLTSIGLAQGLAALIAAFVPLLSIPSRLGFGWLGDIFGKKQILALAFLFQAIGLVLFGYGQNLWLLMAFLIIFGIGYGGTVALRPAIQLEYFGRSAFGSIQGLIIAMMTLGGIAGPALTGWVFDTKGSYQMAWFSFAAATAAAATLIVMMKPSLASKELSQESS